MSKKLHFELRDNIAILTLNIPETRNALSGSDLFEAFEQAVDTMNDTVEIRAAVLTGEGKAFCSGGNLKEMHGREGMFAGTPPEVAQQYRFGIQRIPRALYRLDVPIIAAVNGPAIGAGCDLACLCDVRIASEEASFAESFAQVGIVPGSGGAWLLPRIIGVAKASEMAFTGASLNAKDALAAGLVSKIVPSSKLMEEAISLADQIAQNPPLAVRWTKRLIREGQHLSFESLLEMSALYQALAHTTTDHSEAVASKLARRKGSFNGR